MLKRKRLELVLELCIRLQVLEIQGLLLIYHAIIFNAVQTPEAVVEGK